MTKLLEIAKRATESAAQLGVRRSFETLLSMVDDAVFDFRLATDTRTAVPQEKLRVISPENQSAAHPYVMTRARALRHAFKTSTAPRDLRFNDIGCGKGKVLIVAALCGFKEVRGLDFAPDLISIAEKNLEVFKNRLPKDARVTVECADVTQVDYGPKDCVFFLYNPFYADVMRGFCERLSRSLDDHPRRIWLIYADPAQLHVMLEFLPVQVRNRSAYGGFEFVYLEN
jgi:SAM-dependent methyltransferase